MNRFVTLTALLLTTSVASGACLSVGQASFAREQVQNGMEQVRWRAELSNGCDQSFDADLRARLLDARGNLVYEQGDLVRVPPASQQQAGRSTHVPAHDLARIAAIKVVIIEERPRPY